MNSIADFKLLLIPLGAFWVAQVIKIAVSSYHAKKFDHSLLFSTGGMPSSHTSTVCALATTLGLSYGVTSPVFAIAGVFAMIVMVDAMGVRQTVSNQSDVLNQIIDELFKDHPEFDQRLREFIGHTRIEVIIGAFLGIGLAWWWT
jgi:acid phosphatase family membrane protein YuiD